MPQQRSTLEATVAALRCLEPETLGLEQLIAAFDFMIATQLSHPKSEDSCRHSTSDLVRLALADAQAEDSVTRKRFYDIFVALLSPKMEGNRRL